MRITTVLSGALLAGISACGGGGDTTGTSSNSSASVAATNCTSVVTSPPVSANAVLSAYAGVPYGAGDADGVGAAASFNVPAGVVSDADGTLYVRDNKGVRRVTPDGAVTTFYDSNGAGGGGGLARDSAGNFYFPQAHSIVRLTQSGSISTIAGVANSVGNVDGIGSQARFSGPAGLAFDRAGILYVTDAGNRSLRKITPDGTVTTFIDGKTVSPALNRPSGIVVDGSGTVYVTDAQKSGIIRVVPSGAVSVWAGDPDASGNSDGVGNAARFTRPLGITIDSAGNLYVADAGTGGIRRITPAAAVSTVAGSSGFVGAFFGPDGPSGDGLAIDGAGNVYLADTALAVVRRLLPAGVATTLAGVALTAPGSVDGPAAAARFRSPGGIAADGQSNLYVADTGNHVVRKIAATGSTSTLARGDEFLYQIAADTAGTVYVYDLIGGVLGLGPSSTLDRITPDGFKTTFLSGSYKPGAVDPAGTVYAIFNHHSVARISSAGEVSLIAGATTPGGADGNGSQARFSAPLGLALDASCNVYVADTGNHAVRKTTPSGVVTTLAGMAGVAGSTDGLGSAARFNSPQGIAVDNTGNVYVTDNGNATVRRITPVGQVTTLAGKAGAFGFVPGALPGVLTPSTLTLSAGALYIINNNGIVKLQ